MIIGAVQILLNHPTLFVGSTRFQSERLGQVDRLTAVANSDEHVMLRVRQQVAPVSITIWSGGWAASGTLVFDGDIRFPEARLAVFDLDLTVRYTNALDAAGTHRVTVAIDDLAAASRVHVALGPGDNTYPIGNVPGYEIPAARGVSATSLTPAVELDFILSGFDRPMARLVCALKLIFSASTIDARREAINNSRIQKVVEWLRWLSPRQSLSHCNELGFMIRSRFADDLNSDLDRAAISLAEDVWKRIEW